VFIAHGYVVYTGPVGFQAVKGLLVALDGTKVVLVHLFSEGTSVEPVIGVF
jgi:hypothetical protein